MKNDNDAQVLVKGPGAIPGLRMQNQGSSSRRACDPKMGVDKHQGP